MEFKSKKREKTNLKLSQDDLSYNVFIKLYKMVQRIKKKSHSSGKTYEIRNQIVVKLLPLGPDDSMSGYITVYDESKIFRLSFKDGL